MNRDKILEIAAKAGFHSTKLLHNYGGKFDALCDRELKEIDSMFEFAKLILEESKMVDGQISNVGRNECSHPETLSPDTRIEVKFRDQETRTGYANTWAISWRDIVAYRILKA